MSIDLERAIRTQRRLFNEAIAAHDMRRIDACWLPDIQVSTSSGSALIGRDAVRAAFLQFFNDPEFDAFVRTPEQIQLSDDGATAAERGTWRGLWRGRRAGLNQGGVYMAAWVRDGSRWLIQAELYVPLQ
jgi:ketosteroid isomerase-like protein